MTEFTASEDRLSHKIVVLESLRGLLAVWVLAAHVAGRSLLDGEIYRAHLAAITEPLLPVYVFMILSGFVIFNLLDREPLDYRTFLKRRFFRLVPLYLVVLTVVALFVGDQLHALESLPWQNRSVSDSIKVHRETLENFWPHLAAHLLLIHGLLPDGWLPETNFTFLSQGWSISLEWQFYVLAPLFFGLIRARRFVILVVVVAAFVSLQLLHFGGVGFFPNQIHYFLLGVASYYLYKHVERLPLPKGLAREILTLAGCATIYFALVNPWPIIIWLLTMSVLLAGREKCVAPMTRWAQKFLEWSWFRWTGKVSYSIYLVHIPLMYLVFHWLTHAVPGLRGWQFLLAALPATLFLTFAVSALTYRWIENPAIRWSRARQA